MVHTLRYEVENVIGSGAQGNIVAAFDHKKKQQVAIKIYNKPEPFRREKKAFKLLSKKKVAQVCEISKWSRNNNGKIVVMKRYKSDLFDYVTERDLLSKTLSKKLFKQMCLIIRDIHNAGIAHLDLKLENFLVDENDNPVLTDFGSCFIQNKKRRSIFSKKSNPLQSLKLRGTVNYAAPELFSNPECKNMIDPFVADIYSVGVILHVLETGHFPETDLKFAKENLSSDCYSLLCSLLSNNPNERYSMDEILVHPWLSMKQIEPVN